MGSSSIGWYLVVVDSRMGIGKGTRALAGASLRRAGLKAGLVGKSSSNPNSHTLFILHKYAPGYVPTTQRLEWFQGKPTYCFCDRSHCCERTHSARTPTNLNGKCVIINCVVTMRAKTCLCEHSSSRKSIMNCPRRSCIGSPQLDPPRA